MERRKILFLHYIADHVYHIYKFSNYGRNKIKLIDAGIAFDERGNYTKQYKKLMDKYNLNEFDHLSHLDSKTLDDFIEKLYINNSIKDNDDVNKIPIPYIPYERLTEYIKPKLINRFEKLHKIFLK